MWKNTISPSLRNAAYKRYRLSFLVQARIQTTNLLPEKRVNLAGNSGEICYKLYSVTLKLKVKATPSIELRRTFSPVMKGSKASRVREGGKRFGRFAGVGGGELLWASERFYYQQKYRKEKKGELSRTVLFLHHLKWDSYWLTSYRKYEHRLLNANGEQSDFLVSSVIHSFWQVW